MELAGKSLGELPREVLEAQKKMESGLETE